MALYVVTIKLDRTPGHDPKHKLTGACAVSPECTDVTGQHHSFLADGAELLAALDRFEHVTRIEKVTLGLPPEYTGSRP